MVEKRLSAKLIPFKIIAEALEQSHVSQGIVKGYAIDSRLVKEGDLFFALPGERVDGHDFIRDVAAKGAVGAVVRSDFQLEGCDLPLIRVPDVLLSLQELSRKKLQESGSKVIAITGSLGKTTTKGFVAALLGTIYRIYATPLSYNTQSTVPLSILKSEGNEEYLILEMGMTHPGDLRRLISIAPPDIALLTTISLQHASHFADGIFGIASEKGSIFSHPHTKLGILHRDIPHYQEVRAMGQCKKITFSTSSRDVDYFFDGFNIIPREGEAQPITLNLPNKVHAPNALAAIALARELEVPWPLIGQVAAALKLPPMRFEQITKQGIFFINDAYNANPEAIKGALENLPPPKNGGKVIAVLSEMDALGAYSEEGHTQVGAVALKHADHLLCIGQRCESFKIIWKKNQKPVELFSKRDELAVALKKLAKPGDVVLLKGARSYALDKLLDLF